MIFNNIQTSAGLHIQFVRLSDIVMIEFNVVDRASMTRKRCGATICNALHVSMSDFGCSRGEKNREDRWILLVSILFFLPSRTQPNGDDNADLGITFTVRLWYFMHQRK